MSKVVLGIDISKSQFDVALLLNSKFKHKKFDNKEKGFLQLVEWLNQYQIHELHICMESTGTYGEALATYLFDTGYKVSVVNPAQIKGFSQSELSRTKTDQADAKLIARFCYAMNPKYWAPKPPNIRVLQALVHRLESLQSMYYQENNRLDVASNTVKPSIESVMAKLSEEIAAVKEKIRNHIDQNPDLRQKQLLLDTIPGIGEATIAQILAFIGNVEDFKSAKQLAAFVGLNPKQHRSGSSVIGRTRLSKVGSSSLRKAFYMPALVAKRFNPVVKVFCDRLIGAGKPTRLVLGAAMRKLIHIIYGVLKSEKPFNATLAFK